MMGVHYAKSPKLMKTPNFEECKKKQGSIGKMAIHIKAPWMWVGDLSIIVNDNER